MHAAVLPNALQQIHVIVISFVLYKIDPANETCRASNTLLTDSHEIVYPVKDTEVKNNTLPAAHPRRIGPPSNTLPPRRRSRQRPITMKLCIK